MVCLSVREDDARALARSLSPIQVDKPWFNNFIGVGRFRILGGPRGGQIRSRHMTS